MSEEPVAHDPLDFYRSLVADKRQLDRELILGLMDQGLYPDAIRYGEFRDVFRGVVKSIDGEHHYFQLASNGELRVIKADTETKKFEAHRMMGGCSLGCDLVRSQQDDEDEEKRKGKAGIGGGASGLPPASRPEVQDVRTQDAQVTTNHPGATVATTPQQDGSAERWHGADAGQVLKSLGEILRSTAPSVHRVDPKERQFLIEVMGRTPHEVDSGNTRMNSMQRAQYNQWLTKSLRSRLSGLRSFIEGTK